MLHPRTVGLAMIDLLLLLIDIVKRTESLPGPVGYIRKDGDGGCFRKDCQDTGTSF